MDIIAKKILTKNKNHLNGNWFPNLYNLNIYRGCNHGCIYCDSRSECYRNDDFDIVKTKVNALELLNKELATMKEKGTIGFGSMSDPYNAIEKTKLYTRQALEIIAFHSYPLQITTKSDLITRDIDILKKISKNSFCNVAITITTCDDKLASVIEPYAPSPTKRLAAIKELSEAGIYVGVLLMPLLPWITDNEENVRDVINKVHENGGKYIIPFMGVTLRDRQRDYFYTKISPELKVKYINTFGQNYVCERKEAKKIYEILNQECKRKDMVYRFNNMQKINLKNSEQLSLF